MAYLAMPHLVKFVFLLAIAVLATLSAAGGSITDITDPKYIEAAINVSIFYYMWRVSLKTYLVRLLRY